MTFEWACCFFGEVCRDGLDGRFIVGRRVDLTAGARFGRCWCGQFGWFEFFGGLLHRGCFVAGSLGWMKEELKGFLFTYKC